MSEKTDLEKVQDFIFDDKVQDILSDINNNLMDFNILEITGMGNQEIKHSNILGWLLDDREHNLEYLILDNFLKKVIEKNTNLKELKELREYIYLSDKKRDITIYREENNIDLLIVDKNNNVVIVIENKIYADEREDGDDEGQLKKYEDIIEKKYKEAYKKYYIFLTRDLKKPSREKWAKANHKMVADIVENVLETKETDIKTKVILESYVDLLKRKGIMPNKKIEELCEKIWNNKDHKKALEVLFNNKPNKYPVIVKVLDKLKEEDKIKSYDERINSGSYSFFIELNDKTPFIYRLYYSTGLGIVEICVFMRKGEEWDKYQKPNATSTILKLKFNREIKKAMFDYPRLTNHVKYCEEHEINEIKINELIDKFIKFDEQLNNIHKA